MSDDEPNEPLPFLAQRLGPLMRADWLCLVLLAIPFLFAPWPIGADLPQHAAQIDLLTRALGGDPDLGVHWFAPNSLVYWLLAVCVLVFGPLGGTKLLCWGLAAGATMLSLRLCAQRGTQLGLAVLSAIFLFNSNMYWGFLPFQLGWVMFLGWLLLLLSPAENTPRRLAGFALASFAVLGAHSLWFGAAAVAGIVTVLVRPTAWKQRLVRGLTAIPAGALAAWWGPQVREQRAALGFNVEAHWYVETGERFTQEFFGAAALGNIIGDYVPVITVVVVVALIVLSQVGPSRERWCATFDRELLGIGLVMLIAVTQLPDMYVNSTDFARRWAPHSVALFIMGGVTAFIPRWSAVADRIPGAAALVAAVPLTVGVIWTASVWNEVARVELDRFRAAIDAIEVVENPRTVGLNFVGKSQFISGVPFLQQFAWVQAFHGGTLNFSFTEHGSGLVYDVDPKRPPWTVGLEWRPKRFRPRDLNFFDVVLVGGPTQRHERFDRNKRLEPLNDAGLWRAYRVVR